MTETASLEEIDKKLLKSIRQQLEFYFSEGNLPRDEFMQNCMRLSKHNSIPMSELLKFNKLIELNATANLIKLSVKKSKILQFDDDNEGIKRKTDLCDLKPANSRTVFIYGFMNEENLQKTAEEVSKQLKTKFKAFGKILRLDLPR